MGSSFLRLIKKDYTTALAKRKARCVKMKNNLYAIFTGMLS